MGTILKRWKREESAEKVLESLEEQLSKLESKSQKDEQFYQRFIGRLMFYSIILYIISAVVVYFYYFPIYWKDRLIRTLPLVIFPLIIYGIRRTLQYAFSARKKANALKLEELRSKKQKVIEDVKEKETYKKAKEILEKFDPDNSILKNDTKLDSTNGKMPVPTPGSEVRQRNVNHSMSTPNTTQRPPPQFSATPKVQMMSPLRGMSPAMQRQFFINNVPPGTPPGPPKPISVLPKERTVADKFVDYLVGDGPSNRYALICKACHSHNGMALKEDFEFTTFRCCYCYHLNEAKKERPSAPPLERYSSQERSSNINNETVSNQETHEQSENIDETIEDDPKKMSPDSCSEKKDVEQEAEVQESL